MQLTFAMFVVGTPSQLFQESRVIALILVQVLGRGWGGADGSLGSEGSETVIDRLVFGRLRVPTSRPRTARTIGSWSNLKSSNLSIRNLVTATHQG